ncbi:MAG: chemotaxis protein CheW [Desulfovibrio sp.]|nr:chemotaxis protein CheW [Desulfovibrio sp.]
MSDMHQKSDHSLLQLVTFRVASEEFGIDILSVQEIIRTMEITKVPRAPMIVEGVINLRGKVIPIIDLRKKFGLESKPHDSKTRIIVVDLRGMVVGFVVDEVSEVLRIPSSTVEPPPAIVSGIDSEYIDGVGKIEDRLLILLDLDRLLTRDEQQGLSGF